MPRGEPRRIINFLLSESGHTWFADLAVEHNVTKTDVFRAVLAVAKAHTAELKMILKERRDAG